MTDMRNTESVYAPVFVSLLAYFCRHARWSRLHSNVSRWRGWHFNIHSARSASRSRVLLRVWRQVAPLYVQYTHNTIFQISFSCFSVSAIIEHTNQVLYLEDDDVAAVSNGCLTIHRIRRTHDDPNESQSREVHTLKMEIQQIMKGRSSMRVFTADQPHSPLSLQATTAGSCRRRSSSSRSRSWTLCAVVFSSTPTKCDSVALRTTCRKSDAAVVCYSLRAAPASTVLSRCVSQVWTSIIA